MNDFWKTAGRDASGPLTEEQFFGAMEEAFRSKPEPQVAVLSPSTLAAGQLDAQTWHERMDQAEGRYYRLTRGWRRVRLLARLRALVDFHKAYRNWDSLSRTFGAEEPWVRMDELAAHLGVSRRTVERYVHDRLIPSRQIRGVRHFRVRECERALDGLSQTQPQPPSESR